ncbi:MAG: TonB-dependent receptor [Bacteroidales bacterium]|nr:TonB-dependent receptor [Bacteroidales bacterium]
MKKSNFRLIFIIFSLIILSGISYSQNLTQIVRGRIVDIDTKNPLPGAVVIILNSNPVIAVITDNNGNFELKKVPIGRCSFKISYLGYEDILINDKMINSGKETILNIQLQEKYFQNEEIIIHGNSEKDKAISDIAIVSARTFSIEESNRYAGGFNDLSRMATAFAGVASLNGETNEIVIRGNSPRGLLWRINGIEVSNPNHFPRGDGSSGGGISIITSDIISNSDFFTGAFPAEYGNALSGVFDINLREGNSNKHEFALKPGAVGVEATAEGPLFKKSTSSYLVNYRYSTLAMIEKLGFNVIDNTVIPTFQDIAFNFTLQTKNAGTFNLFGFGGISDAGEKAIIDTSLWVNASDNRNEFEIHKTGVAGIKNMFVFPNHKSYLHTILSMNLEQSSVYLDSLDYNYQANRLYDEDIKYQFARFSMKFNHKFNVKNTLRTGFIYNFMGFNLSANQINSTGSLTQFIDNTGNSTLIQMYINHKHRINENITVNTGIHSMNFFLNKEITFEPRLGIRWNFAKKHALSYGFGLHSQTEAISTYFTKIYDEFGNYVESNQNLKLAKSIHNVIAYDFSLNKYHRLKIEMYQQYLFDIPVSTDTNSTFSTINSRGGLNSFELNNKGKGYNYGIELTLERFLYKNLYFLSTISLFDSKYKAPDEKIYNTLYNSNFMFNFLAGKEFMAGKKRNSILGINTKIFYKKGNRLTPINIELSKQAGQTVYIYEESYQNRMSDFIRWDAGISFRQNKKKYSWIFSLDIQNILNRKNIYSEYYNPDTEELAYRYALPLIPVFNLKVEF